jgi:hypothetical protein
LLAAPVFATDIDGVQPAALDQPRINALLSRTPGGTPLSVDFFGIETFNIQAFYDTGASGILLSNETADFLGVVRSTFNSQTVVYSDVGVAGTDDFNVSETLHISLAPFHPDADVDNMDTYSSVYTQSFGPVRTQIGPIPSAPPGLEDLDVFGMPTMAGKVVVMDPKPVDTFADTMRTYVYNPGTPFNAGSADDNPGIPNTNRHVDLSYASFDRFTTVTPTGAPGPTLRNNPFIGPNPVAQLDPNPPPDSTPPITIKRTSQSLVTHTTTGSWLLDTGAAASIISSSQAGDVDVFYEDGTFGTDSPNLVDSLGNDIADQFTLTIGGIGGTFKAAGFFLDTLTIQTLEGDPITFLNAPVLVADITVFDPLTSQELTLDGIFGMNFLVASAFVTEGAPGELPIISDLTPSAFDWLVFDETTGILGLNIKPELIPEPGSALSVALLAFPLLLRRRCRRSVAL